MTPEHDLIPDGKTGPFLRERHHHNPDGTLVHDSRCAECKRREDSVFDAIGEFFVPTDRLLPPVGWGDDLFSPVEEVPSLRSNPQSMEWDEIENQYVPMTDSPEDVHPPFDWEAPFTGCDDRVLAEVA